MLGRSRSLDQAFAIEGGRHPVVEAALRRAGERFIPRTAAIFPPVAIDSRQDPARDRREHGG